MRSSVSFRDVSLFTLLLCLASGRTVHGVIPIPPIDNKAAPLHDPNPGPGSEAEAEGGVVGRRKCSSDTKKSALLESVIVGYYAEEDAGVVVPEGVRNEEGNCADYDTDEEWEREEMEGEGGASDRMKEKYSQKSWRHDIQSASVCNYSRKSRKILLLKVEKALQDCRITAPRDFMGNLQLSEKELSMIGGPIHRGGRGRRGRRGGGGGGERRDSGVQLRENDELWLALVRERERLRAEHEEVSRRNYHEAEEAEDSSLQAAMDAQTIWEAAPNPHSTIFCAWIEDCHGCVKRFAFCSGEGLMVPAYRQATERLGYDVVKTGGGHAEMQFLQFLYKRHVDRPGLYTNIVAMGCTQRHCKECDCVLKLVLGPRYTDASTVIMERRTIEPTQETEESFVLPLQFRVAQHGNAVEERMSDKFLVTEDLLNLIKAKIPIWTEETEQSIEDNFRHHTAKRKAE